MSLICTGNLTQELDGSITCDSAWEVVEPAVDRLANMLELIFAQPDNLQIQEAFMAGFSLPLICFMTAWAYGFVIGFASRSHEPRHLDDG